MGEGIGTFVFLDRTRSDLPCDSSSSGSGGGGGVTILGCTIYSQISREQGMEVAEKFVDFRDIVDWDVGDHTDCHEADVEWLNRQVDDITEETGPERKIVIMTHYSPTIDGRTKNPRYPKSTVDSGFMTDLSKQPCWKSPLVKLWAFGHTHYNVDFMDEDSGKRVVANQKGYHSKLPSQREGSGDRLAFDVGKTVDIRM